eukprot:COSAG04_NODE_68_length_29323_cov_9.683514_24_plen_82_part_00
MSRSWCWWQCLNGLVGQCRSLPVGLSFTLPRSIGAHVYELQQGRCLVAISRLVFLAEPYLGEWLLREATLSPVGLAARARA